MNNNQTQKIDILSQQWNDQLSALIAEGVQKFPKELQLFYTSASDLKPSLNNDDLVETTKQEESSSLVSLKNNKTKSQPLLIKANQSSIHNCNLCQLSLNRLRVVAPERLSPKHFFVLSDFPEKNDEICKGSVFSDQSSTGIILNLLDKLGISKNAHLSFAVKCHPEKGLPSNTVKLCAENYLKKEIQTVSPAVLFCFGSRALFSLSHIFPDIKTNNTNENYELENIFINQKAVRVFVLPSTRELSIFPNWRIAVWKLLKPFEVKLLTN